MFQHCEKIWGWSDGYDRVKEFVPEPNNPGTGERLVNFKKEGIPEGSKLIEGSKGLKRTSTPEELNLLQQTIPKK